MAQHIKMPIKLIVASFIVNKLVNHGKLIRKSILKVQNNL